MIQGISKIIACPGEALLKSKHDIDITKKSNYINALLKVGFDAIEVGCFAPSSNSNTPNATEQLIEMIEFQDSVTKLIAIVPNFGAALEAIKYDQVKTMAFPFSISKTHLKESLNTDFDEAHQTIQNILRLSKENHKQLLINVSMAFGNHDGDYWDISLLDYWVEKLMEDGVSIFNLIDTTGDGNLIEYKKTFETLVNKYPNAEFGLRIYAKGDSWLEKLETAYQAGCRRFDVISNPKAGNIITGNPKISFLSTAYLLRFLDIKKEQVVINQKALEEAVTLSQSIFK